MTVRGKAGRRDAALNHPAAFSPVSTHTTNAALSAAVTLTPPADNVNAIIIQTTTQNVRVTLDGVTTPTATVGFLIETLKPPSLIILTEETSIIRIIETAASATINYQWGTVATSS
jgi:hypothetical protein